MLQPKRDEVVAYLKNLRDSIIAEFETLERPESPARFERTTWPYKNGKGGGEMSVIRGKVFEKAAVNWSGVEGTRFPGSTVDTPFFATGVSLITHMSNPKAPTSHFNIRYIEKGDEWWIGGGFDLTPMGFPFDEDTSHFHQIAKESLDPFGADLYPKMKEAAREYFTIRHYNRERGVGGIFFDHFRSDSPEKDMAMWQSVGDHFIMSLMPILHRRIKMPFTAEDREAQLKARAHYVEFNLLYDRGTKFGFESGGNPAAILCSMPPLAAW